MGCSTSISLREGCFSSFLNASFYLLISLSLMKFIIDWFLWLCKLKMNKRFRHNKRKHPIQIDNNLAIFYIWLHCSSVECESSFTLNVLFSLLVLTRFSKLIKHSSITVTTTQRYLFKQVSFSLLFKSIDSISWDFVKWHQESHSLSLADQYIFFLFSQILNIFLRLHFTWHRQQNNECCQPSRFSFGKLRFKCIYWP